MIRQSKTAGGTNSAFSARADLSYLNVWQVLRRRWILMVLWLTVGWGAAVAYWRFTPPMYESSVQVLVMRKNPSLPTSGVQHSAELESKISEDLLATHMQIVQSRRIVAQALERNGLDQLPSIQKAAGREESPAEYVIKQLDVTRGGGGQAKSAHVLNIAFRHTSDVDAQQVVEAIAQRYRDFLSEQFQDVNKEAASLIARAREDLEKELETAEAAYLASRKNTPLLWNGEQSTNIHRVRYEQIQAELSNVRLQASQSKAQLETVQAQLAAIEGGEATTLERLALIDETSLTRVGAFADIYQGKAQTAEFLAQQPARLQGARVEYEALLTLLTKEKTLMEDFGANHPEVISTRHQIDVVRSFINEREGQMQVGEEDNLLDPELLLDGYVRLLENNLATLTRRENELELLATQEEQAAKTLVAFELEDQTLRKQIDRKRELYDTVVERLGEINLAGDYGGFINEVIAPAEIGEEVWPKLPLCLALGAFMGLLLGSSSAVISELRDRSFHSPEEVIQTLDLPLLAQLHDLRPSKRKMSTIAGTALAEEISAFHRRHSREAEAFRSLRTSLFFMAQKQDMKVIACTSPNQGDGKSTLVANLAVSIAQAGRRVLVIDCDLRRPRVHTLFGLSNSVGLSDVLTGAVEPWETVQTTDVNNLWVLPCGSIPGDPAEMLESPAFREFLHLARERYDIVLLDTAPVLAVSDPCIVAPQADGVLLVLRVSRDSRPQAMYSKEALQGIGAEVVGVVINGWDAGKEFNSGEYAYYGRHDEENGYYRPDDAPVKRNGHPAHIADGPAPS